MPSGTPAAEYSLVNFGADTENVLNNWIEPVAQSLMDGVNGIIITVFTVWLLWQGYRFLWGEYKSSKEFLWSLMKGGFIVILAVTMDLYSQYIIDGVQHLDSWLIGWLPSTSEAANKSVWQSISDLWTVGWDGINKYFDFAMDLAGVTTSAGWIALILGLTGYFLLAVFLCAVIFGAVLTLLIAKFSIALLVVTGPIFIACGLYATTKEVAMSWIRSLIANCLTIFFLALIMSLVSSLMEGQWNLLSEIVAAPDLTIDDSGKMMVCFKAIFLIGISSFALCFVMNSLAKIAQSLVGGAALSAGGWGATAPFIAGFSTATRLGKVPLKAGLGLAGQGVMQAGKLAAKGVGKAAGMGAYGIGAATNAVKGSGSSSGVSSLKGGLSRAASGIAGWWNGVPSGSGATGSSASSGSSGSSSSSLGANSAGTGASAGSPGMPGSVGPAGSSGPAGSAGQAGSAGPAGSPGMAGSNGVAGAAGAAGAAGSPGRSGTTASVGSVGAGSGSAAPRSAAGTRVFKPFNSPGTALSATGSQYFRMGLINTAANQRGIVGRTAGVVSGVIEKTVAERNYMKSIAASSSGKGQLGPKPATLRNFVNSPEKHINQDLKPFVSDGFKAKEVSKEPNTETNSEIKDKKGKDEK